MSCAAQRRRQQRRRDPAAARGPAALGAAAAARRCRSACSGCASGTTRVDPLQEGARAACAFSATQCSSRAAMRITPSGSTSSCRSVRARRRCRSPARSAPGSSVPRAWPAACHARSGSKPGRAQQLAGADQRQADQRGRVVGLDRLEQRDAQRLALGAAGAVVGLLGAQVVLDLGVAQVAEAHRAPAPAPRRRSRWPRSTTATAVWNTTLRPRIARSCCDGALVRAGLADRLAVQIGHLVGADHHGVAGAAPPPPAPWPAPAAAPGAAGVSPGSGVSSTSGDTTSNGRRRRSSSSRR